MRENTINKRIGTWTRQTVKRNAYDAVAFGIALGSIPVQKWAETHVPASAITSRFIYDAIYNTGDFAEALLFGSVIHTGLRLTRPNMHPAFRVALSTGISAGLIGILETVQFSRPLSYITGTADMGDMKYGLLGAGVYAGIATLAEVSIAAHRKLRRNRLSR